MYRVHFVKVKMMMAQDKGVSAFMILCYCLICEAAESKKLVEKKVNYEKIFLRSYCHNDTNPSCLPGSGESSAGLLMFDSNSQSYPAALNCTVTLCVQEGYQLLAAFSSVSLRNRSMDTLTVIYDNGNSQVVLSGRHKCPHENCTGLMFDSGGSIRNITFKFLTANVTVPKEYTGFTAVYTVYNYMDSKKKSCLVKNHFLCANSRCIDKRFICDEHNNCGDLSDEIPCSVSKRTQTWAVVVIVIAAASVLTFVPLFCFLANYGTRSTVKSVTLPSKSTPLYPTANDDETTNLLTSSGPVSGYWSSGSFERRQSCNYGCISSSGDCQSSTSNHQRSVSFHEGTQAKTIHS